MNKKLYLILFLGFLAISFYPYNKSNFVISANKKLVNDTVKTLTKENIMGEYNIRSGYGHYNLRLFKDTFKLSFGGCTFSMQEQGKWYYKDNLLSLIIFYTDSCDTLYCKKYEIIRQDIFLICLERLGDLEEDYQKICKLHNAGLNPTHSTFLHKKLENHKPVSIPTIPATYHKFLLKKPITCQITAIENDTTITINVGKQDGVFEGLQLHKKIELGKNKKQKRKKREDDISYSYLSFEIIDSQDSISIIKINKLGYYQQELENIKKLQIGDTLGSKRD